MLTRSHRALTARQQDGDAGFTLIELLVVVLIIGILAAIAIPIFVGQQNQAKDGSVKSDLATAKTAVFGYFTDSSTSGTPTFDNNATTGLQKYGFATSITDATKKPQFKASTTPTASSAAWCIFAVSPTGTTWNITNTAGPASGACA